MPWRRNRKTWCSKDWLGQRIEPNSSFTLVNNLPGLVPNDVIRYRYTLAAASSTTPVCTVKERESTRTLGVYSLGTIAEDLAATAGTWSSSGSSTLSNNTSQLNIAYQSSDPGAKSWIDWVEINYPRLFWAVGNVLHFRAPDTNAVVEYRLQQFTETPWVFNVSSYADVRLITGVTGSYMFQASEVAGQPSEYWSSVPCSMESTGRDRPGSESGSPRVCGGSPVHHRDESGVSRVGGPARGLPAKPGGFDGGCGCEPDLQ